MDESTPVDRYVDNGPVRLHYVDWGGGDLPPMVLLHGLRDCARSWDIFARSLSSEYRVIALDSRGHGDSAWAGPGGYRFQDYISDIEALVEHCGLSDMVLVGHSAGGRYAWNYAVANPDRVRSLVVVDIDPDRHNPQTVRDFADIDAEPDSWSAFDEFVQRVKSRQVYTGEEEIRRHARVLSRKAAGGGFTWKADIRIITEYERPALWESWGRITCPVLLVRGRQSPLLTHETAVRMRQALPESRVRLAELEGGGHWFYQDFPGAFEAVVRWYLDDFATSEPEGR